MLPSPHLKPMAAVVPATLSSIAKRLPIASSLVTRFSEQVDVRHRGVLRTSASISQINAGPAPAVVRLWRDSTCDEMSAREARALAAQLMEAAALAERQNQS